METGNPVTPAVPVTTDSPRPPVVSTPTTPIPIATPPIVPVIAHAAKPLNLPNINTQVKRTTDDLATPSAKRPKTDGTSTPGLMGPPSAMNPPTSLLGKKREEGLDEGDPNDVFGGAGINLQDEERNMTSFEVPKLTPATQSKDESRPSDRARKSDFLDLGAFNYLVNNKLSEFGLKKYENETHGLIGLALKERLTGLISRMVVLAKHRCAAPPKHGKPIDDVGRILRGISLREAQEEERRRTVAAARRAEEETKRREAEDASAALKKKPGAARTMSEQAIARNANATAQMMLNQSGGKKYSWMTGAPNTSQLPRRNTVQSSTGIQANVFKLGSEEHSGAITLKDFINALELEGEDTIGRGGRALVKAYANLKD